MLPALFEVVIEVLLINDLVVIPAVLAYLTCPERDVLPTGEAVMLYDIDPI